MVNDKIFEFIKKVNAIAHTGITYSTDEYALDNYHELLDESTKMLNEYIGLEVRPYDIYHEFYYPTPQPCVRTLVIKNDKLLLVQEAKMHDKGKWSLPGGWCDIDTTPMEAAIKETKEESGLDVKITKLLGIQDRRKYRKSKMYEVYNIFFLAKVIGGEFNPNFEVLDVGWFDIDNLPELSTKTTMEELMIIYNNYKNGSSAYFE
ncbi:NUDIX hydrolase N-terminal domain-containing protein [Mycoplasmatota bacterium]|nr:NUDIX hydrolase N-terminal domain-containing protein [Mycoplasmatota bacterium]